MSQPEWSDGQELLSARHVVAVVVVVVVVALLLRRCCSSSSSSQSHLSQAQACRDKTKPLLVYSSAGGKAAKNNKLTAHPTLREETTSRLDNLGHGSKHTTGGLRGLQQSAVQPSPLLTR